MRLLLTMMTLGCLFLSCNKTQKIEDLSYTFLERHGYYIDSYNGIFIHRLNESDAIMDGYYVISNEFGKAEEFNVDNGILNGESLAFHSNNEIYSKTNYVNGKRQGEYRSYYPSGKLQKKTFYSNDILVGPTEEFFESGQLQTLSKIEDGHIVESTSYDIIGTIVSQSFEQDNRTHQQKIQNGKIAVEEITSNYDDYNAIKFFDQNGDLEIFIRMKTENDERFIIELDDKGDEIKRVNIKKNPEAALKYTSYFTRQ